jgi:YggT family protein
MTDLVEPFNRFMDVVRAVLLGVGVLAGLACAGSWAVRTRRVSPFGFIARVVRAWVDPALRPVERMIVRAGGAPATAPWWGLVFILIVGVLVIGALDLLAGIAFRLAWGLQDPARLPLILLSWSFAVMRVALVVRVLSSWLPISPFSRWIRWSFVLTEWMLRPLRQVVPAIGPIDATPIVAYLALWLVQTVLRIP